MKFVREEWLKLRESRLFRNAGWMLAGEGMGFFLQIVYFVILARLLGAAQFGIFVGAFSFTGIVAQYSSLGSGVVFIRYVSGDRAAFAAYWGNILAVTTSVGAVLVVALSFLAPHVLNPLSAALVPLAGIANCLCAQLTIETGRVFQAFEQLHITAVLNLLTSLMRAVIVTVMLVTMHHASAWQWAIASTSVSLIGAGIAVSNVTLRLGRPRFQAKLWRKHALEGFGYAFAGSTTVFYNDIDKTMLSHYGMNLANGIYAMAYRVIDFATIPVSSMQAAAISRLFQRGRTGLQSASELSMRLLKRAVPLTIAIALAIFLAAPLVPRIVGQEFAESTSALRWLCLIPVFRSVQVLTGAALTGAGYQSHRTTAQVIAAALNFGLNLWWIPAYGWQGAAWSSLLTDGAIGAMNSALLRVLILKERGAMRSSQLDAVGFANRE